MAIRPSDLRVVPLFEGITDAHLTELTDAFERLTLPKGSVLFEAKSAPTHFLLLAKGEVALQQEHETRFVLAPIAPIGELGSLTGARRSTTAVTTAPSEIWRIGTDALVTFFERNGDVAYPFFHNLVHIVSDKIRRDARRVEAMRDNLIRTQKAMKALLERVLEMEETPLSRTVAETLEDLIEHNRRGHYLVEPSRTLKGSARLDDGTVVVVEAISEGWVRLGRHPAPPPWWVRAGAASSSFQVVKFR